MAQVEGWKQCAPCGFPARGTAPALSVQMHCEICTCRTHLVCCLHADAATRLSEMSYRKQLFLVTEVI